MATTIAGVAMAGGGFVLKSARKINLVYENYVTFSVQNEGDFCFITSDDGKGFIATQIDDMPVEVNTNTPFIMFGKNITVKSKSSSSYCHIFEYGPAE